MQQLTVRQTVALWGGFGLGKAVTPSVRAMNVTNIVSTLTPTLEISGKTATVHIGVEKFMWARSKQKRISMTRQIIDARSALLADGVTHIAVTGPFLIEIRRNTRLSEVATYRNAVVISRPVSWLYRLRVSLWGKVSKSQDIAHKNRLGQLRALSVNGFETYGVFQL